jgi:hypothetical protein
MHEFQTQLVRLGLFALAIDLIAFIVGMFVLYLVIKAAIRDGIQESGLIERLQGAIVKSGKESSSSLPYMRAD